MKVLRQILHCAIAAFIFLISSNCKSRNTYWRETLNAQMELIKNRQPLDSSMYSFMLNYHIPAMSVTVGQYSVIIYSKTFGLANLSRREPADPLSLFRVDGLSTAITSLAISKLIQQGKLSYGSKVFGEGGILGTRNGHKSFPTFVSEITIADLLRMESGGWSGADDYITYIELRGKFPNKDSAVSYILDDTASRQQPGTVLNFSYTGFFILGAVIEKVTGSSYEDWVIKNILAPCGITTMQIEKEGSRNPHEVTYYKDLDWPLYNGEIDKDFHLAKADAAMGWIATSHDMVRLMQQYKWTDSAKSNQLFFRKKSGKNGGQNYMPDWTYVPDSSNWWLQFNFNGSSSILVKSSKGFYWSILINTYRNPENDFFNDLDSLIVGAMRKPDIISGSKKVFN